MKFVLSFYFENALSFLENFLLIQWGEWMDSMNIQGCLFYAREGKAK